MAKLLKSVFSTILVCCAGDSAAAQIAAPSIASLLPDVSAISPANAAGVLQYCVQHQLVSSTAIEPVLSPLTSKKDIKASPLYSDGKQGRIVAGGKTFSLGQANGYMRSQVCDLVFRQAARFK